MKLETEKIIQMYCEVVEDAYNYKKSYELSSTSNDYILKEFKKFIQLLNKLDPGLSNDYANSIRFENGEFYKPWEDQDYMI